MLASLLVATMLAEGLARLVDGDALPVLDIFQEDREFIGLQARAHARLRSPSGLVYDVDTDALGLRRTGAERASPPWLVVGDSQVLGLGVHASQTMIGQALRRGFALVGAGVPAHGVEDALAHAARLLPRVHPKGLVVVANQANDWDEAGSPVATRFQVRRGLLVSEAQSSSVAGRLLDGPLSRSHLFHGVLKLYQGLTVAASTSPRSVWLLPGERGGARTERIATAIERFAAQHPDLPIVVAFLPVDAATSPVRAARSPFARWIRQGAKPWEDHTLRDSLRTRLSHLRFIDLSDALSESPDMFLERDYHLSPGGHAAVAAQLLKAIASDAALTASSLLLRGGHEH